MARIYKGTVRQTPSGSWCVWYYPDDPETGKRKQKAKGGFRTRKAAEAFLTEVKKAQLDGTYVDLKAIGFKSLCEKFLTEYAPLHLGELTVRGYRSGVARLVSYFGERPVASIQPGDVQALVAALAASTTNRGRLRSPKSVNNALVLLHRILRLGKQWGYLRENAAAEIEHLRVPRREMAFHTREEIGKLLHTATGDAKAVLALALLCGMRRGEIAGLAWPDMDFDRGQIQVRRSLVKRTKKEATTHGGQRWHLKEPKSQAGCRVLDMIPAVRDILEVHRLSAPPAAQNPRGLVFTRPGDRPGDPVEPWDPEHLTDANYSRVCKAAGVRVLRLHDCRHTHTALRLSSGTADIKYIQRQLGHSSIQMTMDTYGHLFQETNARETNRLQAEVEAILAEPVKAEGEATKDR